MGPNQLIKASCTFTILRLLISGNIIDVYINYKVACIYVSIYLLVLIVKYNTGITRWLLRLFTAIYFIN